MLYLFNSAARPEYVKNILNTLHLPNGAINMYQYEIADNNYVDSSIKKSSSSLKGEKVIIAFIDRDDEKPENNKYIPLRFGILKKYEEKEGKIYLYVELNNYISKQDNFDSELKASFKDKLFYKENGLEHGFLAFKGNEIVSVQENGDNTAWLQTVKRVMDCSKLKESNCIYTRFTLFDKKSKTAFPISAEKNWYYELKTNKSYTIIIDYYIPFAKESPKADTILFEFTGNCQNYMDSIRKIWGVQNGKQETQVINYNNTRKPLNIEYFIKSSNESQNVVFSDVPISITFKKKSKVLQTLPFLFFGISTFISTLIASMKDYTIKEAEETSNVIDIISKSIANLNTTTISVILAVCAVFEALTLFWMKKLSSKDK